MLADARIWEIAQGDRYAASRWNRYTDLVLAVDGQRGQFQDRAPYGGSAAARFVGREQVLTVVEKTPGTRRLRLDDGSLWEVDYLDWGTASLWSTYSTTVTPVADGSGNSFRLIAPRERYSVGATRIR